MMLSIQRTIMQRISIILLIVKQKPENITNQQRKQHKKDRQDLENLLEDENNSKRNCGNNRNKNMTETDREKRT